MKATFAFSLAALFLAGSCLAGDAKAKTEPAATKPPETKPMSSSNVVLMKTSLGDIKIQLNAEKAPITVKNFLGYVDEGQYDGTIFHRVISTFMIQGGGFTTKLEEKRGHDPIKNEAGNGLKNKRGTIAMARTGVVDSATAQFFINVVDNGFLDHRDETMSGFGYCVFGEVIEGMDVVDKIKAVKNVDKGGAFTNLTDPVVEITSVKRIDAK